FVAVVESSEDTRTDKGAITLNDSSITTSGDYITDKWVNNIGSHGVAAKHASNKAVLNRTDDTTTETDSDVLRAELGATIEANGGRIVTSHETSSGVVLTGNNSSVTLTGVTVESAGASIRSILDSSGDVQTINVVSND